MFKNILVASDGSKCGDKAVDLAIDLASKYGAKISALYVMDFALDFSYDDLDDAGGAVLDEITAKGKEKDVVVVEHIITADPIQDMATMIRKIKNRLPCGTTYFLLNVFIVKSIPAQANERIASPKIFRRSGIAFCSSSVHSPRT